MKTLNLIFVFLLVVFISLTAYNQECNDFLESKIFKITVPKKFVNYGQSKSEYIEVSKPYKFEMVFSGSQEYIMNIATKNDYGSVQFRIISAEDNMVLYDNKKYNYKGSANFYMEKTQPVTIEVTIIAADKQYSLPENLWVCLGIKIFSKKYIE